MKPRLTLSTRQLQIIRLVANGKTNKSIADLLRIAPGTVSAHMVIIMAKLGAQSRAQAVARVRNL